MNETLKNSIKEYQAAYQADYGFEAEMVRYRQAHVTSFLERHRPRSVIEIGCGPDLLAHRYHLADGIWDDWLIIEPAPEFASIARKANLPRVSVREAFFQDAASDLPENVDVILCAGLLHEVPDAKSLASSIASVMGPQTVLHANVPNAKSLHRRLARAMGLIDELTEQSTRNRALGQPRVFDADSFTALIESVGLRVTSQSGHLLKPFTHDQMEAISEHLGRTVLDGLYRLGEEHPEWASEISLEARRA